MAEAGKARRGKAATKGKGKTKEEPEEADEEEEEDDGEWAAEAEDVTVTIAKASKKNNTITVYADDEDDTVELYGTDEVDTTDFKKGDEVVVSWFTDDDEDKVLTAIAEPGSDDEEEEGDEEDEAGDVELPDAIDNAEFVVTEAPNEKESTVEVKSDELELEFTLYFLDTMEVDFDDYPEGTKILVTAEKDTDGDMVATAVPEVVTDKKSKGKPKGGKAKGKTKKGK
jgi:hypothetical protein